MSRRRSKTAVRTAFRGRKAADPLWDPLRDLFRGLYHSGITKAGNGSMIRFRKELYSRTALLKAAYHFTDTAYVHLDSDERYYYVTLTPKEKQAGVSEQEFTNELLAQSVRHEIYLQTKDLRELTLARAMASSLVVKKEERDMAEEPDLFTEDEILKDWFSDEADGQA